MTIKVLKNYVFIDYDTMSSPLNKESHFFFHSLRYPPFDRTFI